MLDVKITIVNDIQFDIKLDEAGVAAILKVMETGEGPQIVDFLDEAAKKRTVIRAKSIMALEYTLPG